MKRFKQTMCLLVAAAMLTAGVGSTGMQAKAASLSDEFKTETVAEEPDSSASEETAGEVADSSASEETSGEAADSSAAAEFKSMTSQEYVKAMGQGWNLGNSFDGVNTALDEEDAGETAWGNPEVTKELIQAVKAKGYDSIRMPMTLYRRYQEADGRYVIDEDWLACYKQVVDWAVEEGLYVMVNIHHDSWIWLSSWDGNTESEEYVRFVQLWEQLADYFKDESELVCFETINEPAFSDTDYNTAQEKLDLINKAAYDVIRSSGGNNDKRMLVIPTMNTNYEKSGELYSFMETLDDPNLIATVHYYSEWVYSANLGKTGFDEVLWDEDYTPRKAADKAFSTIYDTFTANGIGVVVGEYGLLGYDTAEKCNQPGEELKYYEYINELAREDGICLMFWDNGSGICRTDGEYSWKKPLVGVMLEASMEGRSSYATELDTIYFGQETEEDVAIALTLNGNTFVGIDGLEMGTDYVYDEDADAVILNKDYVNKQYNEMGEAYGTMSDLVFQFSSGAPWHEYLVKYGVPEAGEAEGSVENGIVIPVSYKGSEVRRISAYEASGLVGPNSSWWSYLQYADAYIVDESADALTITSNFFTDSSVADGVIQFKVEYYDGQIVPVWLEKKDGAVVSSNDLAVDTEAISISDIICLYEGETEIPAQYIHMPEGGRIYGTYSDDENVVKMTGWPAEMEFSQTACENFTNGGVVLYYMDVEKYVDVQFGVKKAPAAADVKVFAGEKKAVSVENLAGDAAVTYKIADKKIATVSKSGVVTGKKAGETELTVTVKQYNRKDSFTVPVTVAKKDLAAAKTKLKVYIKNPLGSKKIALFTSLTCDKKLLIEGKNYTVSITKDGSKVKKIAQAGTYEVTVKGKGSYEGTVSKTVEIVKTSKKVCKKKVVYWKIK